MPNPRPHIMWVLSTPPISPPGSPVLAPSPAGTLPFSLLLRHGELVSTSRFSTCCSFHHKSPSLDFSLTRSLTLLRCFLKCHLLRDAFTDHYYQIHSPSFLTTPHLLTSDLAVFVIIILITILKHTAYLFLHFPRQGMLCLIHYCILSILYNNCNDTKQSANK